ncbi:hypothetical protein IW261DRAFT_1343144, partial [Armillaria novae-zelandiae]
LDQSLLSIDKFLQWLRALCTIMIARNDWLKAVGYVKQAVRVIEGSVGGDEVSGSWFMVSWCLLTPPPPSPPPSSLALPHGRVFLIIEYSI